MSSDELIDFGLEYIMRYTGNWYKWGGNGPVFDCSGLAMEYLKAIGAMPRKSDHTAQNMFHVLRIPCNAERGSLVFYGRGAYSIDHVEICLNESFTVGASGGGRSTNTVADAIRDNAFIKVRPININRGIVGYRKPWPVKG